MVLIVGSYGRLVTVEYSQTVSRNRMSYVATELAQLGLSWLDARVEAWADGCFLVIHPVAVVRATSCSVTNEDVVRMRNPEASRRSVCVEQAERWLCSGNNIILNQVLRFCSILDEDGVTHCIVICVP